MLIGKTSCGKTTLCQSLHRDEIRYKKTQAIEFLHDVIDTPGEYVENKSYYRALMVTCVEAQAIMLLQDCTDRDSSFPPGFSAMFGDRPVLGVVTKTDLAKDDACLLHAEKLLRNAGAHRVFLSSAVNGMGIDALRSIWNSCD